MTRENDECVSLTDMRKLEAVNYDWGAVKWVCNDKLAPGCCQSVGYVFVLPGKTNPQHYHTNSQEVVFMLSGEIDVIVGKEKYTLKAGQTAVIPLGVKHIVVNNGWEPATYVASFSASNRGTLFSEKTSSGAPEDTVDVLY
jgi:quercetin dioxygenase-like cupin family protein